MPVEAFATSQPCTSVSWRHTLLQRQYTSTGTTRDVLVQWPDVFRLRQILRSFADCTSLCIERHYTPSRLGSATRQCMSGAAIVNGMPAADFPNSPSIDTSSALGPNPFHHPQSITASSFTLSPCQMSC